MLVYSTCTFSSCENEEMIAEFLSNHPNYTVRDLFEEGSLLGSISGHGGPVRGISTDASLRGTCRILPHISLGEGHYCAVLLKSRDEAADTSDSDVKDQSESVADAREPDRKNRSGISKAGSADFSEKEFLDVFNVFARNTLSVSCAEKLDVYFKNHLKIYGSHVYTFNMPLVIPDGVNVVKKGLYLGEMKRTRVSILFEPSHQFILSLNQTDLRNTISLDPEHPFIDKYLKGETLFADHSAIEGSVDPGRYVAICVKGYPLGWAKAENGGMLKNLYPKGWRRQG
jgi:NOL1/NOP2/fmu family ribosome biogenesis protein